MADVSAQSSASDVTATVAGNRLTLLAEGPEKLEALLALIEGAEHSLRILFYIFLGDESGRRVRDALIAAAGRGVAVSLLVDGFGSAATKEEFFKPLGDSAARFCRFAPRFGRRYLLRNHQKLALADERTVLIGGFNVADDYFGTAEQGAWRDLGLRVEGDDVRCLAGYFDGLFDWASNKRARIRDLRRMLAQHSVTEGKLHWLFGGPTRRLSPWARAARMDMTNAGRLDMIAAYFAPNWAMLRRISRIGRRGTARLVTAAKSDNTTTIGAARHTYWRLLRKGVEVYEYQATKLHSKLIVIDDIVHIGSANFDIRSLYLNLEMMLRVDDTAFAEAMRRFFDAELGKSVRITREAFSRQRTVANRLRWSLAYFIVAVMDYNVTRRLNFGPDGK